MKTLLFAIFAGQKFYLMVSLNQVTVSFGGFDLFRDVSFLIGPRERVGLVGKNGAGKTTILKLIVGEMTPSGGSLNIPRDITVEIGRAHV